MIFYILQLEIRDIEDSGMHLRGRQASDVKYCDWELSPATKNSVLR